MSALLIDGFDDLKARVGDHLGFSGWLPITQERVDRFADATGDHQWIHVDPERARRESPFGGAIAHGYLTLALTPTLLPQVVEIGGVTVGVNYGCNRVRFMSPVRVGASLRLGVRLVAVDDVGDHGVQVVYELTFETDDADKPACVAEIVIRLSR